MMNKEPLVVVGDILSHELGLDSSRIFLYNSTRELPKDDKLYLVLEIQGRPPYAVKHEYKVKTINNEQVYCEVTTMNVQETVYVSCVSKDNSARLRAYEVQLSMNSDFAIQQMFKYGFHISQISGVTDASALEASSRLNRYDCQITLLTAYEKVKPVEYYDTFEKTETKFEA